MGMERGKMGMEWENLGTTRMGNGGSLGNQGEKQGMEQGKWEWGGE